MVDATRLATAIKLAPKRTFAQIYDEVIGLIPNAKRLNANKLFDELKTVVEYEKNVTRCGICDVGCHSPRMMLPTSGLKMNKWLCSNCVSTCAKCKQLSAKVNCVEDVCAPCRMTNEDEEEDDDTEEGEGDEEESEEEDEGDEGDEEATGEEEEELDEDGEPIEYIEDNGD